MKKKYLNLLAGLILIAVLAACSTAQANTAGNEATGNGANPQNRAAQMSDPASMAIEMKLAIGTLKLEGTENSITAEQARELLPLWKALRSLSRSDNGAQDEIDALYVQIQESMTAEQIQSIQALTWTQDDLAALRETFGVQAGFGGDPSVSEDQRATRMAEFQASGGAQMGGGPGEGGGGGMMPPDGGGGMMPPDGGEMLPGAQDTGTVRTPSAAQLNRQAMGFNSMFADAVIQLLQERAGTN